MGRFRSETTTLVFAVCAAVALGIACGAWINARLASAASETSRATAQPMHAAPAQPTTPARPGGADTQPDYARQTGPAAGGDTSTNNSDTPSVSPERRFQAAEDGKAPRVEAPSKSRENPPEKASATGGKAREVKSEPKAARGRSVAAPCSLYASAGSLTLRSGGTAALVLGGPGEAGRISVSTPDWANIAVFNEGRAGGNGWVKFSVKSVSGKAGVYNLHFKTPCGSQTIHVKVVRP